MVASFTGPGPPAEHWAPVGRAVGCTCWCAAVCPLPGTLAAARSAGAAGGARPQPESPPTSSALCPGQRYPSRSGEPGPGGPWEKGALWFDMRCSHPLMGELEFVALKGHMRMYLKVLSHTGQPREEQLGWGNGS